MSELMPLPPINFLKNEAKRMGVRLRAGGNPVKHSQTLELLAHDYGYKDWNTLYAAVGNMPPAPVLPGQRVCGQYLGQYFSGTIIGVQSYPQSDRFRVTTVFDEPVDVVTFDSFSSYRKQVSCTVGQDGKTAEKTSNGEPQLSFEI